MTSVTGGICEKHGGTWFINDACLACMEEARRKKINSTINNWESATTDEKLDMIFEKLWGD